MKIWTNTKFEGYWSVGTAAVVVADSAENASEYMNTFLAERGLKNSTPEQFIEMPIKDGEVSILADGNY